MIVCWRDVIVFNAIDSSGDDCIGLCSPLHDGVHRVHGIRINDVQGARRLGIKPWKMAPAGRLFDQPFTLLSMLVVNLPGPPDGGGPCLSAFHCQKSRLNCLTCG